jgi:hypothetical protein
MTHVNYMVPSLKGLDEISQYSDSHKTNAMKTQPPTYFNDFANKGSLYTSSYFLIPT